MLCVHGPWVLGFVGRGCVSRYRSVPANTKVEKLMKLLEHPALARWEAAPPALRRMRAHAAPLPELEMHDPSTEGWVGLDACHEYFQGLYVFHQRATLGLDRVAQWVCCV
jgi:hypothetical protein